MAGLIALVVKQTSLQLLKAPVYPERGGTWTVAVECMRGHWRGSIELGLARHGHSSISIVIHDGSASRER